MLEIHASNGKTANRWMAISNESVGPDSALVKALKEFLTETSDGLQRTISDFDALVSSYSKADKSVFETFKSAENICKASCEHMRLTIFRIVSEIEAVKSDSTVRRSQVPKQQQDVYLSFQRYYGKLDVLKETLSVLSAFSSSCRSSLGKVREVASWMSTQTAETITRQLSATWLESLYGVVRSEDLPPPSLCDHSLDAYADLPPYRRHDRGLVVLSVRMNLMPCTHANK